MIGYVLAGGQSSRMGQSKAALRLGGQTLVEIAARKLQPFCDDVVVVWGERDLGPVGDRTIRDLHPGCGPIGGMEAALGDLREQGASWAMFVPVDMPLVPPRLLGSLVNRWLTDPTLRRVCLAEVGGRVQPLLSLLHAEIRPYLQRSVAAGTYKVAPALFAAAGDLARTRGLAIEDTLEIVRPEAADAGLGWTPTAEERRTERLWFQNANTPAEFQEMEQLLREPETQL